MEKLVRRNKMPNSQYDALRELDFSKDACTEILQFVAKRGQAQNIPKEKAEVLEFEKVVLK